MKIILLLLLAVLPVSTLFSQQVIPYVDERAELMGIIFHLADSEEYNDCKVKSYNDAIASHFDDLRDHEAVIMAKEFEKGGIGYDAVIQYAIHLEISNGEVSFNKKLVNNLDYRWENIDVEVFTKKSK